MKSIMHDKKDRTCYLCMMLHGDDSRKENLQEHHVIYGNGRRKLSERYGLKVYLCLHHHTYGSSEEAVHSNAEVSKILKKKAQEAFEEKYSELSFLKIFGKSYTDDSAWQQSCEECGEKAEVDGFRWIEGVENMDGKW